MRIRVRSRRWAAGDSVSPTLDEASWPTITYVGSLLRLDLRSSADVGTAARVSGRLDTISDGVVRTAAGRPTLPLGGLGSERSTPSARRKKSRHGPQPTVESKEPSRPQADWSARNPLHRIGRVLGQLG